MVTREHENFCFCNIFTYVQCICIYIYCTVYSLLQHYLFSSCAYIVCVHSQSGSPKVLITYQAFPIHRLSPFQNFFLFFLPLNLSLRPLNFPSHTLHLPILHPTNLNCLPAFFVVTQSSQAILDSFSFLHL